MLSQNRAERLEVDLLDAANPSFFHPLPSCPNPKPCGPIRVRIPCRGLLGPDVE
jgi:hypothetical protein